MIKVVLDDGAIMPRQAHPVDAGYDLFSRDGKIVPAGGSEIFDTGVHIEIPNGFCGLIVSKSGLNVKGGITSTGMIDQGYTGSICVKLYNQSDRDYYVFRGDKISQLVLIPCLHEEYIEVESLGETERGSSGFGSTGR